MWVLFTGTVTDDQFRDSASLSAVVALPCAEATFAGYSRKVQTTATVTVDNTNNWVLVDDTTDPSWSPTSAQALTRIGCFYDPDTTTGTDADLIPLFIDDFALTTATSGTLTYTVASGGFGKAA